MEFVLPGNHIKLPPWQLYRALIWMYRQWQRHWRNRKGHISSIYTDCLIGSGEQKQGTSNICTFKVEFPTSAGTETESSLKCVCSRQPTLWCGHNLHTCTHNPETQSRPCALFVEQGAIRPRSWRLGPSVQWFFVHSAATLCSAYSQCFKINFYKMKLLTATNNVSFPFC